MKSIVSIRDILSKYHKIEIELLLAHLLKKSREFIFLHPKFRLSAYELTSLLALAKRRQKGEPIAYILGYKDFYGLRFMVNKNVLIPRPETEGMVERVADCVIARSQTTKQSYTNLKKGIAASPDKALAPRNDKLKILDLGTGSGNVIISFAKTLGPMAEYYASDISRKALGVARQNAKAHNVKITFVQSDLLENIKGDFDIIIANLPYLSKKWAFESTGIKFEPQQALFAKEKGLMLIKRFLSQIAARQNKPKFIFLEFDPRQKAALTLAIKKYLPKAEVKFYKDYAGLWRCAQIKT